MWTSLLLSLHLLCGFPLEQAVNYFPAPGGLTNSIVWTACGSSAGGFETLRCAGSGFRAAFFPFLQRWGRCPLSRSPEASGLAREWVKYLDLEPSVVAHSEKGSRSISLATINEHSHTDQQRPRWSSNCCGSD